MEANARLIASAPDLAVLLAEAVGWMKRNYPQRGKNSPSEDLIRRAERALGGK